MLSVPPCGWTPPFAPVKVASGEGLPLGFWKSAVENLRGDPGAGLAAIAIIAAIVLLGSGQDPRLGMGFPGTMYLLYLFKGLFDNHHERKMAEFEVRKIEAGRGQLIQRKTQRALERRRAQHGNS